MNKELKDAFSDVYKTGRWGNPSKKFMSKRRNKKFYSGGGADLENDKNGQYIKLLQEYIDKEDVKKVVEVGCGDWEVSSYLNLDSVEYYAYDVVQRVINYNKKHFKKDNIHFICEDIIGVGTNKTGDLLIMKDVIQHLPIGYCTTFVHSIPNNFKYNVITNDQGANTHIGFAGYSSNNFVKSPFNMECETLMNWEQKFKDAGSKITLTLNKRL